MIFIDKSLHSFNVQNRSIASEPPTPHGDFFSLTFQVVTQRPLSSP